MTDNHLAQLNFTAILPRKLFFQYIDKTNIDHVNLGRIRFMDPCDAENAPKTIEAGNPLVRVFGRVSHGYGYDISQDIFNAITYSKGVKKNV